MAGDYPKQLQLAKQLEQKTKEAARNRKEAEDLLAQAEKDVATSKKFEASTAEAEKLLEEGRHSYSQKDYQEALSLATKSSESSAKARTEKVESILAAAEQLATLVSGKKAPEGITVGAAKACTLLAEGGQREAYEKAKALWSQPEGFVNKNVGELFGTV